MSEPQPTAEQFASVQRLLLPRGRLWSSYLASTLTKIFLAVGDELVRVSGRGADLLAEMDPRKTAELLGGFEGMLELSSDGTNSERRARIVSKTVHRQRIRPADYRTTLAPLLDQDAADVVIIETSRATAIATGDDQAIYRFYVYRDPSLPGSYSIAAIQKRIDEISHSHVQGKAIESRGGFICNSPNSLCNRDLL